MLLVSGGGGELLQDVFLLAEAEELGVVEQVEGVARLYALDEVLLASCNFIT